MVNKKTQKEGKQDNQLNVLDLEILRLLQKNSRTSLNELSHKLSTPKSTLHYRISKLEEDGVIQGYYTELNPSKLGLDFVAITLVRAKFGSQFHEKVGNALAKIAGVHAVFFLFGEIDFLIIIRSRNKADLFSKIEKIYDIPEVERSNTLIVAKTIKNDQRFDI
jgi:DNA-binding Lrp family transcriptional regulator